MAAPDCEFCTAQAAAAQRMLERDAKSPFLSIDDRLFRTVVAAMPEMVNWKYFGVRAAHGPHPAPLTLDSMANGPR